MRLLHLLEPASFVAGAYFLTLWLAAFLVDRPLFAWALGLLKPTLPYIAAYLACAAVCGLAFAWLCFRAPEVHDEE